MQSLNESSSECHKVILLFEASPLLVFSLYFGGASNETCFHKFKLSEQVYDVTKFLEDHPGGDEVLLSATGICYV